MPKPQGKRTSGSFSPLNRDPTRCGPFLADRRQGAHSRSVVELYKVPPTSTTVLLVPRQGRTRTIYLPSYRSRHRYEPSLFLNEPSSHTADTKLQNLRIIIERVHTEFWHCPRSPLPLETRSSILEAIQHRRAHTRTPNRNQNSGFINLAARPPAAPSPSSRLHVCSQRTFVSIKNV